MSEMHASAGSRVTLTIQRGVEEGVGEVVEVGVW
jgi:hypothetical protein